MLQGNDKIWVSPLTKALVLDHDFNDTPSYSFYYDEIKEVTYKADSTIDAITDTQVKAYLEEFFASQSMTMLGLSQQDMVRCIPFTQDGVSYAMRFNWTKPCPSCAKVHTNTNGHQILKIKDNIVSVRCQDDTKGDSTIVYKIKAQAQVQDKHINARVFKLASFKRHVLPVLLTSDHPSIMPLAQYIHGMTDDVFNKNVIVNSSNDNRIQTFSVMLFGMGYMCMCESCEHELSSICIAYDTKTRVITIDNNDCDTVTL